MACPARGMETPTPSASSGSSPIETNSVVPIANPPVARASSASVTVVRDGEAVARAGRTGLQTGTRAPTRDPAQASRTPGLSLWSCSQVWYRLRSTTDASERSQDLVEGRGGTHHLGRLLGVGAVVAADVGRAALDVEQLPSGRL